MKFMKLGTRPDTFFTMEAIRSVSSEVSTDLEIQIMNNLYLLHKVSPNQAKDTKFVVKISIVLLVGFSGITVSSPLQMLALTLCADTKDTIIRLHDIPGGAEAFEMCVKFCYGITITLSALNLVPVRCASEYLGMRDDVDKGNLSGKLDVFFKSCILGRWKDTLVGLQSTRQYPLLCEELGLTGLCIDAAGATILAHPSKASWHQFTQKPQSKGWWGEDISELGIDHYWRIMVGVKTVGGVPDKIIGEALQLYARRWLPNISRDIAESSCSDITHKQRLVLERIVGLLPLEKGSLPCSFLMKLLKASNVLSASSSSKMELVRRAGAQLEEATISDLLIPCLSNETQYDVDIVSTILEEFMLQWQSPPTSPPRTKLGFERRRSRSAENMTDFECQESGRRSSSSASHSSKLRVARLIDNYLQEIASDPNLAMEKVVALAEAVPDFARPDHDDLYRFIDIYLMAHPELDKNRRKRLCRVLDCKKLSVEACMHAAQNDRLPLRLVVQVLFFEQARAAMSGAQVTGIPSNIKDLLAGTDGSDEDKKAPEETKIATLKMKLEEADSDFDDVFKHGGLLRSSSSRLRTLCSLPTKPKRMLRKFWTLNRSVNDR